MRAKDFLNSLFGLSLALSAGTLVSGCDDDSDGDDAADDGMGGSDTSAGGDSTGMGGSDDGSEAAQFEVTVNYEGSQEGNLTIAAFTMWPPAGPPSAANAPLENPTFPTTASLSGLAPGEYTVVAIYDVGEPNPTAPGDEDLVANSDPITIEEGGDPIAVDLTLVDM